MLPLLIAGTGLQAFGSLYSGEAAANAAEFNAQRAERDAMLTRRRGVLEQAMLRSTASQILGAMRANIGASGVRMEGSPLDVLEHSAATAKLDQVIAQYNNELQAMGLQEQASLDRMQAKSARVAGAFGAASSLLLGGYKAGQLT